MKRSLQLLVLFLFTLVPISVNARGPGSGSGGKGVRVGEKVFLLDFTESGIEQDPAIDPQASLKPEFIVRLAKAFKGDVNFPLKGIAQKLAQILNVDYGFGITLLKTIEAYEWKFVEIEPSRLEDQREGLCIDSDKYVQVGKRLGRVIIIHRPSWNQMDEKNRIGLVFHEIIYALAPLKSEVNASDGTKTYWQDTGAVQELNAFLFSRTDFTLKDLGAAGASRFSLLDWQQPGLFVGENPESTSLVESPFLEIYLTENGYPNEQTHSTLVFSEPYFLSTRPSLESAKRICDKIENKNVKYLDFEIGFRMKVFSRDSISSPSGDSFSFISIKPMTESNRLRIRKFDATLGAIPIKIDDCDAQIEKLFGSAKRLLNQSFHQIPIQK